MSLHAVPFERFYCNACQLQTDVWGSDPAPGRCRQCGQAFPTATGWGPVLQAFGAAAFVLLVGAVIFMSLIGVMPR